jgi:murein DD-endopeptidase MepM/ murein hydrolase activator NlpD
MKKAAKRQKIKKASGAVKIRHNKPCIMHKKLCFFLALILLLLLSSSPMSAEKNSGNDRDGVIQIDGHWIGLNWPLADKGVKSSNYGVRIDPFLGIERAHGGIDIACPLGKYVLAAIGGRVTKTGFDEDLGKYIVLIHSGSRETIYGHISEIKVKEGQFVNPRSIIGKTGDSGRSTGPHLHFALKKDGKFVDPQKWIVPTGMLKNRD